MRIISGQWRGRRIASPDGCRTRPILDRAKTVLFDVLGHQLAEPGRLPPIAVLDLFAGSGTLGLEAVSRGARYCLFVERRGATARLIRRNLDTLGVVGEADVLEADATVVDFPPPPVNEEDPSGDESALYELVFVDPPFRMLSRPKPDRPIRDLLQRLTTSRVVAESSLIVVRHAFRAADMPDLEPLVDLDHRNVGKNTLRFMRPPKREGRKGDILLF